MDFTPSILHQVVLERGRLELVEWHWPDIVDFQKIESDLMLEMSVAPYATDASVEFPALAPGDRCFMGTLFVRYPGVAVHGRGEGGHIRVIRFVLSRSTAQSILPTPGAPPLNILQSLLDIKSDSLRALMRLAYRELTNGIDQSVEALDAILNLVAIELRRLFERQSQTHTTGRLAAWQYRRIRERLTGGRTLPTAIELATLCGISPRHLHRQFRSLTGNTITEYIESFQIERAKEMLLATDFPIHRIAHTCGFLHSSSFARAFRRSTGTPPAAFRQKIKGVRQDPDG
jgi:AraC family transcriptional regulator